MTTNPKPKVQADESEAEIELPPMDKDEYAMLFRKSAKAIGKITREISTELEQMMAGGKLAPVIEGVRSDINDMATVIEPPPDERPEGYRPLLGDHECLTFLLSHRMMRGLTMLLDPGMFRTPTAQKMEGKIDARWQQLLELVPADFRERLRAAELAAGVIEHKHRMAMFAWMTGIKL